MYCGVGVGVRLGVRVAVGVSVAAGVGVEVPVGVRVTVNVAVGMGLGVNVAVGGITVELGIPINVGEGATDVQPDASTTDKEMMIYGSSDLLFIVSEDVLLGGPGVIDPAHLVFFSALVGIPHHRVIRLDGLDHAGPGVVFLAFLLHVLGFRDALEDIA